MSLSILADENIPAVEHYVGSLGRVRRFSGRELDPGQLAGVDALLVRSVTPVDARLLAGSPVRFVGTATSGVEHVDRTWLGERGIVFRHAPGANANSVVEYVLAAIAAVGDHLERLLDGGCIGIVGYGHIGRAVAHRFGQLGIRFRVYDPWLEQDTIPGAADWEQLLSCDVLTLHPELTREQPWPSYHLLDAAALSRLNRQLLLINASRGAVVDNSALAQWLQHNPAADVVLDVWEHEPRVSPELLRRVRLGTPHIAGYSVDGKLLATRMLVAAMAAEWDLSWQDPGPPMGEAPALALPAEQAPAPLLRYLLEKRYRIRDDDAALRNVVLQGDPAGAAAGFDQLRRRYPPRRELLGSAVTVGSAGAATRQWLEALGCVPEENG